MPLRVECLTVDARDPRHLASFWCELLGYEVTYQDDESVMIRGRDSRGSPILFYLVDEEKPGKNRLHLDLAPGDQDAEVARALSLGAQRADIGQTGEEPWVVLADPEGNEFCILTSR